MADLHPDLENIGWLVGTWWGFGVGGYPTIEAFRYEQEITFSHDGRPVLAYTSSSWLIDDEGTRIKPSSQESGFWRATPQGLEVLIAQQGGIVEIYVGQVAFSKIELVSDLTARTQTAMDVTTTTRLYGKVEDDLGYAVDMAAMDQSLQSHISARLQRVTHNHDTEPRRQEPVRLIPAWRPKVHG